MLNDILHIKNENEDSIFGSFGYQLFIDNNPAFFYNLNVYI